MRCLPRRDRTIQFFTCVALASSVAFLPACDDSGGGSDYPSDGGSEYPYDPYDGGAPETSEAYTPDFNDPRGRLNPPQQIEEPSLQEPWVVPHERPMPPPVHPPPPRVRPPL